MNSPPEKADRRAKCVHMTTVHEWNDARIFVKECRSLAEAGYEVVYINPHERAEVVEGVRLVPLAVPVRRWVRLGMLVTTWRALRAALREHAQVYHFHEPELMLTGLLLKLGGKRVVYDQHENWPQQVLPKRGGPFRFRCLRLAYSRACALGQVVAGRVFDGIVAATSGIGSNFPAGKTVVLRNLPRIEEILSVESKPFAEREAQVLYIGGITIQRGARDMVEAMGMLPAELPAQLVLAGYPHEDLFAQLDQLPGWGRTTYLGTVARTEVAELLAASRIGLAILHPIANYVAGHPNKLTEYMAAGLPVIATDLPLMRATIEDAGCGLIIPTEDPGALAEAIQWLLEHPEEAEAMGRRGQEAARDRYNWEAEKPKLLQLYARLTGGDH